MNTHDDLQQIFDTFEPQLPSGDQFMQSLSRKLEMVEYVKNVERQRLRRFRLAVVVAFACGAVMGAACYSLLLSLPIESVLSGFSLKPELLSFLLSNGNTIALGFTSIVVVVSVLSGLQITNSALSQSEAHV